MSVSSLPSVGSGTYFVLKDDTIVEQILSYEEKKRAGKNAKLVEIVDQLLTSPDLQKKVSAKQVREIKRCFENRYNKYKWYRPVVWAFRKMFGLDQKIEKQLHSLWEEKRLEEKRKAQEEKKESPLRSSLSTARLKEHIQIPSVLTSVARMALPVEVYQGNNAEKTAMAKKFETQCYKFRADESMFQDDFFSNLHSCFSGDRLSFLSRILPDCKSDLTRLSKMISRSKELGPSFLTLCSVLQKNPEDFPKLSRSPTVRKWIECLEESLDMDSLRSHMRNILKNEESPLTAQEQKMIQQMLDALDDIAEKSSHRIELYQHLSDLNDQYQSEYSSQVQEHLSKEIAKAMQGEPSDTIFKKIALSKMEPKEVRTVWVDHADRLEKLLLKKVEQMNEKIEEMEKEHRDVPVLEGAPDDRQLVSLCKMRDHLQKRLHLQQKYHAIMLELFQKSSAINEMYERIEIAIRRMEKENQVSSSQNSAQLQALQSLKVKVYAMRNSFDELIGLLLYSGFSEKSGIDFHFTPDHFRKLQSVFLSKEMGTFVKSLEEYILDPSFQDSSINSLLEPRGTYYRSPSKSATELYQSFDALSKSIGSDRLQTIPCRIVHQSFLLRFEELETLYGKYVGHQVKDSSVHSLVVISDLLMYFSEVIFKDNVFSEMVRELSRRIANDSKGSISQLQANAMKELYADVEDVRSHMGQFLEKIRETDHSPRRVAALFASSAFNDFEKALREYSAHIEGRTSLDSSISRLKPSLKALRHTVEAKTYKELLEFPFLFLGCFATLLEKEIEVERVAPKSDGTVIESLESAHKRLRSFQSSVQF